MGDEVKEGDLLCEIIHPLEGSTVERIVSPIGGTVFFMHSKQLVMEASLFLRVIIVRSNRKAGVSDYNGDARRDILYVFTTN